MMYIESRGYNKGVVACNHSCRTETLSTLRFAQRAKSIQNKAVVNEESGNDVNLLREQIRQLKVCTKLFR
jgi:kinesin family protein 15